jgi:Homeodomain-like domain-containing protein
MKTTRSEWRECVVERTADDEVLSVKVRAGPASPRATRWTERARVLVEARRGGWTLREAAAAVGVHVATVCRWQKADPALREALLAAALMATQVQQWGSFDRQLRGRSQVPTHKHCPLCNARVTVRAARSCLQQAKLRFWRCGRWPLCKWASWRPRASALQGKSNGSREHECYLRVLTHDLMLLAAAG